MKMTFKSTAFFALLFCSFFSCGKKEMPGKQPLTYEFAHEANRPQVFFTVTGMEGYWTLEISPETIRFISAHPDESQNFPYQAPVELPESGIKTYTSKSDGNEIVVTILKDKCRDGLSKTAAYEFKVKVKIKTKKATEFTILQGCGNYIPDSKLDSQWRLKELFGRKAMAGDFESQLPYLDFSLAETSFSGYAGCNRIKGQLQLSEGGLLRFENLAITEMACKNTMENQFVEALRSTTKYEIKSGNLYLLNKFGTQAVFEKVL